MAPPAVTNEGLYGLKRGVRSCHTSVGGSRLSRIGPRRLLSVAMGLFICCCLVGCSASLNASPLPSVQGPESGFSLVVHNVDGPPVVITVNGKVMARSVCLLESNSPAPFVIPTNDLPLPWSVAVLRADGSSMGTWVEAGNDGPRQILIRGNVAAELPADQPAGPAPASCPP